jgi:long-chain fatty acid transport protein
MNKKILSLLGATLLSANVYASGFQVALQGNKQVAMGHTGTALAHDASSVFFNPAAMSYLRQNGVTVGGNGIFSSVAYRAAEGSNYTARTDNPMGTPFHAYGVFGPQDGRFKFGLGVYTPYGSSVRWGDEWAGRFLMNQLTLQAITFQPTASFKIADWLSVGAGFTYTTGSVKLQRNLDLSIYEPATPDNSNDGQYREASVELDGRASGMGFNAGIYLAPTEQLSVGITYRSRTNMRVNGGTANFDVPSALRNPAPTQTTYFPEGNTFNATLPLASVTSIGIGYKPTTELTLAFDVNYTAWAAYDSLIFEYATPLRTGGVDVPRTASNRNYSNAFAFRGGVQYAIHNTFFLRGGAYYDMTPVQAGFLTPETADADRLGISGGVGFRISDNFTIDTSLLYIRGMKREQTQADVEAAGTTGQVLTGTYKLAALIPGISLSVNF